MSTGNTPQDNSHVRRVLVTGATGAVGTELSVALIEAGHEVFAATRDPGGYRGPGTPLSMDLDDRDVDPDAVLPLAEVGYYLVHALDRQDFAEVDRQRAARFARAWGPERPLVYLGGLGEPGTGSAHLRSRHEVGEILREHCATVELRASIVIGPDSLSFRLLRALAKVASLSLLPVAVPRGATALTQPIAQADLTAALVGALDLAPGSYDIGGPEVLSFAELIERSAQVQGRRLKVLPTLPLGADWLGPGAALLADVDPWATTALFASLSTETIVRDGRRPPNERSLTDVNSAIRAALGASR